jgi:hypothetical protein
MMTWIELRKRSGISQFACAKSSGVSRVRLSLAENAQVTLTPHEEASVRQAINDHIHAKSKELRRLEATIGATA